MKTYLITSRKSGGESDPVPSICSDSSNGGRTGGWLGTTRSFSSRQHATPGNIKNFINGTQFRTISVLSDPHISLSSSTTFQFHMSGCGVSLTNLTSD